MTMGLCSVPSVSSPWIRFVFHVLCVSMNPCQLHHGNVSLWNFLFALPKAVGLGVSKSTLLVRGSYLDFSPAAMLLACKIRKENDIPSLSVLAEAM